MKTLLRFLPSIACAMLFFLVPTLAHAAVDTAISGPVDDLTSFGLARFKFSFFSSLSS